MAKLIEPWDGGEAFPLNVLDQGDSGNLLSVRTQYGMSLRAWLAGQVIGGLCANPSLNMADAGAAKVLAQAAVLMADAVIAELERTVETTE